MPAKDDGFLYAQQLLNNPPIIKGSSRMKKAELLEGVVEDSVVSPNPITTTKIRLMKVVSITVSPGCRIATIQLDTKKSRVELAIDEPTARAIAKVFD
jgi:hypothetical protein